MGRRRNLAAAVMVVVLMSAGLTGAVVHRPRGYFGPIFVDGGSAVLVVVRDVRSLVLGFGYEGVSPPAHVRIQRDRLRLVRLDVATGREEVLVDFPPSPLEGSSIHEYRYSLYGSADASLLVEDGVVQFTVAVARSVTRDDVPSSFVLRGRWSRHGAEMPGGWEARSSSFGGGQPAQLSGPFEVIAVRGAAPMPCAVVLLAQMPERTRALAETDDCRKQFSGNYDVAAVHRQSSRALLERAELLKRTRERLVAEARSRGRSEGEAALEAIRGMERLGLSRRPTQVMAQQIEAAQKAEPIFEISDEEFDYGLFSDIREAIDQPGTSVDKRPGAYIVHRQFDTSRRLNDHLRSGVTSFVVRARGMLWRLTIEPR